MPIKANSRARSTRVQQRCVGRQAQPQALTARSPIGRVAHGAKQIPLSDFRFPERLQVVQHEEVGVQVEQAILAGESVGQNGAVPGNTRILGSGRALEAGNELIGNVQCVGRDAVGVCHAQLIAVYDNIRLAGTCA